MTTRCRSCEAEVVFLRHERTGNTTPIEAKPHPAGDIAVDLERGTWRVVRRENRDGLVLYRAHFAVCKDAGSWRKRS